MQAEKSPNASKKSEEDYDIPLPWEPMIDLGVGYSRFKRWSEIVGIATVGFALGAFGPIPSVAKIGVLITLVAITVVLSVMAAKVLAKATRFQQNQLSTMKVREVALTPSAMTTEVKIDTKE